VSTVWHERYNRVQAAAYAKAITGQIILYLENFNKAAKCVQNRGPLLGGVMPLRCSYTIRMCTPPALSPSRFSSLWSHTSSHFFVDTLCYALGRHIPQRSAVGASLARGIVQSIVRGRHG
jgi:hypothetical protein